MDFFFIHAVISFSFFQACISKDYGKGGEGNGETDKWEGGKGQKHYSSFQLLQNSWKEVWYKLHQENRCIQ